MIPPHFTDFASIVQGLTQLESDFRANNDERGIFCTAYLAMTRTLREVVESNDATRIFKDPAWITTYAVAFANLYRDALIQDPAGTEPKAWDIAFQAANNRSALVFQDVLLGINAHINRDLPYALKQIGMTPFFERHADHVAINQVLQRALKPVQQSITNGYAAGLGGFFDFFDPFDDDLTNFGFTAARDAAWGHGLALSAAPDEHLPFIQQTIERNASAIARLILRPTTEFAFLMPILRHLEATKDWQEFL